MASYKELVAQRDALTLKMRQTKSEAIENLRSLVDILTSQYGLTMAEVVMAIESDTKRIRKRSSLGTVRQKLYQSRTLYGELVRDTVGQGWAAQLPPHNAVSEPIDRGGQEMARHVFNRQQYLEVLNEALRHHPHWRPGMEFLFDPLGARARDAKGITCSGPPDCYSIYADIERVAFELCVVRD